MDKTNATTTALDLLNAAPVDWELIADRWLARSPGIGHLPALGNRPRLDDTVRSLEAIAARAAMLATYLDNREGHGCGDQGHVDSLKAANRVNAKVRKALGYQTTHALRV